MKNPQRRLAIAMAVIAAVALMTAAVAPAQGEPPPVSAMAVMEGLRNAPPAPPRARRVRAMPPSLARAPQAVVLARTAWLEAGAHVVGEEVAALNEVIQNRRFRRRSYQRTAWAYSVALRNPGNAWAHRLGERDVSRWSSAMVREHWPRVLELARRARAGELRHGCGEHPLLHWGGPRVDAVTLRRLERRGFVRATCPAGVHNVFMHRRVR